MSVDTVLTKARRSAPPSLDLDELVLRVQARNAAMIAEWQERFPGSVSAVVEVTVPASGHTRRRLRRYREMSSARRGTPGVLMFSHATTFGAFLDCFIIEISAAAARAGVSEVDWRFLTVAEALTASP
jgi:hypothetical protein